MSRPGCMAPLAWLPLLAALWLSLPSANANGGIQDANQEMMAAFLRVGDGDCMAEANRPVRGLSKRDLSHLGCRLKCENSTCLGYSYAPCERICTLYGDPSVILTHGSESWTPLNGWGMISTSSGMCGIACFIRMDPCPGGNLISNGAAVTYEEFRFGTTAHIECPEPYRGTLSLTCGLGGVNAEGGRCQRDCAAGNFRSGSFTVPFARMYHGDFTTTPCHEARANALGEVTMTCWDGEPTHYSGTCGFRCAQGSLRAGSGVVAYPELMHNEVMTVACPAGYAGSADVECSNGYVNILSGRCDEHCYPGMVNVTIGPTNGSLAHDAVMHGEEVASVCEPSENLTGNVTLYCADGTVFLNESKGVCYQHCHPGHVLEGIKSVDHNYMLHDTQVNISCNPGFSGVLLVECWNGSTTVLTGDCNKDCNGLNIHVDEFLQSTCEEGARCVNATVTSNGVSMEYGFIPHGGHKVLPCPNDTHTGELNVQCNDGFITFAGVCGANCAAGVEYSAGAHVSYPTILHAENITLDCPDPWGEQLNVRCYDGEKRFSGLCGRPCDADVYRSFTGAIVTHPQMSHQEVQNFSCEAEFQLLSFSGVMQMHCVDSIITRTGNCYPDCTAGQISNNGLNVFHPDIGADRSVMIACDGPGDPGDYGIVEVKCDTGQPQIVSGTCGSPCEAQQYESMRTADMVVVLPMIQHTGIAWVRCNPMRSGQLLFQCLNAQLAILDGSCGMRCAAAPQTVYGANFVSPRMEHMEHRQQMCVPPYTGSIDLDCVNGELNVTSHCRQGCFAGTIVVNGAPVQYPEMLTGQQVQLTCPEGYAGQVRLECVDEVPIVMEGICHAHCMEARFFAEHFDVLHPMIPYNNTLEVPCPEDFDPNGYVILRCQNGQVVIDEGGCHAKCSNGRYIVRPGVVFRHQSMNHGDLTSSMNCPSGFVGSVRLDCQDGVIGIGMGGCPQHCGAGGVQGASFSGMLHEEEADLVCPEFGTLRVKCVDGEPVILGGECIYGCEAGTVIDSRGSAIEYLAIEHEGNTTGTCSGGATGFVRVNCSNTVVTIDPLPGQQCYRHCTERNVTTFDGSILFAPNVSHGQTTYMDCPPGRPGVVSVQCFDDEMTILEGWCGPMNCYPGERQAGEASVPYPQMNHLRTSLEPVSCPAGFLGAAHFGCENGSVSVLNVTHFLPVVTEASPGFANTTFMTPEEIESHDDEFFRLCGCCVPPEPPQTSYTVPSEQLIFILYWAIGTLFCGIAVALIAGAWYLRPRAPKISRVSPDDVSKSKVRDMKNLQMLANAPNNNLALENGRDLKALAIANGSGNLALEAPRQPELALDPKADLKRSANSIRELKAAAVPQNALEWRSDGLSPKSMQKRTKDYQQRRLSQTSIAEVSAQEGYIPPLSK